MALLNSLSTVIEVNPERIEDIEYHNISLISSVLYTIRSSLKVESCWEESDEEVIELVIEGKPHRFEYRFEEKIKKKIFVKKDDDDYNFILKDSKSLIRSIDYESLSLIYNVPHLWIIAHPNQLHPALLQTTLDSISTGLNFYLLEIVEKNPKSILALQPPLVGPSHRKKILFLSQEGFGSISPTKEKKDISNPSSSSSFPLPFLILQTASLHPHLTALHWSDPSHNSPIPSLQLSFLQLAQHAFHLSQSILPPIRFSKQPLLLVGICMPKNPFLPLAMLAVSMAGAAYLNLDPTQPTSRLKAILEQCPITLLITFDLDHSYHHLINTLLEVNQTPVINLAHYFRHLLFIDKGLIIPSNNKVSLNTDQNPKPELDTIFSHLKNLVKPDQPAYVVCTSGTTGTPKAIRITHSNLSTFLQNYRGRFGRRGPPHQSRVLQFASTAFDVMVMNIWDTLWAGATVCITTTHALRTDLIQVIKNLSVDTIDLTPTVASMLLLHPLFTSTEGLSISQTRQIWKAAGFGLRRLNTGAEIVPVSLKRAFLERGVDVCVDYGPTETTVGVVSSLMLAEGFQHDDLLDDIGKPTGNNQVFLLDEHAQLVPFGAVGEICISGGQLSPGYLDPQLDIGVFVEVDTLGEGGPRRIYRTGDLARYLPDGTEGYGSIKYLGRKDCQVKVSGVRVELGEVEFRLNRLVRHPDLQRIVVDQPESQGGLIGFLNFHQHARLKRLRPSPLSTELGELQIMLANEQSWFESIINFIRSSVVNHLSDPMIPRAWTAISSIPLQISGKTDRNLLKKLWKAHHQHITLLPDPNPHPSLTLSHLEQVASSAWREALGIPPGKPLKLTDEFVRMGGDSIGLMKLVGQVRRQGFALAYGPLASFGDLIEGLRRAPDSSSLDLTETKSYQPFELLDYHTRDLLQAYLLQEYSISSGSIEDLLPSSPAQEAILSSSIGSDLYYAQAVYNLDDLSRSAQALAVGLRELVVRHGMLRTRFFLPPFGRLVIQCVFKPEHAPLEVPIVVLEEGDEIDQVIDIFMDRQRNDHRVYQWGDPNVELRIFSQGDRTRLVWSMHHAVSDGWSLELLLKELIHPPTTSTMIPNYGEFVKTWLKFSHSPSELERSWRRLISASSPIRWPGLVPVVSPFKTTERFSGVWKSHGRLERLGRLFGFTPALVTRVACAIGIWKWLGGKKSGVENILMGIVKSGREIELAGDVLAEEVRGCCVTIWPSMIKPPNHHHDEEEMFLNVLKEELEAERKSSHQRISGGFSEIEVLFTFQGGGGFMSLKPDRVKMPSRFAISFEITPLGVAVGDYDDDDDTIQVEVYLDSRFGVDLSQGLVKEVICVLDQMLMKTTLDDKKDAEKVKEKGNEKKKKEEREENLEVLKKIWANVLGIHHDDHDDHDDHENQHHQIKMESRFKTLGGDSIGMMRLIHQLKGSGYILDDHVNDVVVVDNDGKQGFFGIDSHYHHDVKFGEMVNRMRKI